MPALLGGFDAGDDQFDAQREHWMEQVDLTAVHTTLIGFTKRAEKASEENRHEEATDQRRASVLRRGFEDQ
jgi:hypothetical protein